MPTTERARREPASTGHLTSAITWVDRRHFIVASSGSDGAIDVQERDMPADEAGESRALVEAARALGDHDRILVAGSPTMRTALEREYVAIYHRPDRLVDIESTEPLSRAQLVDRLRDLG